MSRYTDILAARQGNEQNAALSRQAHEMGRAAGAANRQADAFERMAKALESIAESLTVTSGPGAAAPEAESLTWDDVVAAGRRAAARDRDPGG